MKTLYNLIWNRKDIKLFYHLINDNSYYNNANKDDNNTNKDGNNLIFNIYSCFRTNRDGFLRNKKNNINNTKKIINIYYTGERFLDDINSHITIGFLPSNIKYDSNTHKYYLTDFKNINTQKILIINSNNVYTYNYKSTLINFPTIKDISKDNNYNIDLHKDKVYIQIRDQEREHLEYLLTNSRKPTQEQEPTQEPIYSLSDLSELSEKIVIYRELNSNWLNYGEGLTLDNLYEKKPNFCCFIVKNPNCVYRNEFFKLLSRYKKVDSYGMNLNNMGNMKIPDRENKKDYYNFLSKYRFMITFENNFLHWYNTEKIFNAFQGNTVPIYLGDPLIGDIYNLDSFINVIYSDDMNKQLLEFNRVIDKIKYLEDNPEEYIKCFNAIPINNARDEDYRLAESCHFLSTQLLNIV